MEPQPCDTPSAPSSGPDDLSVLALGSDPMFACFCPAIGNYQTPYRPLARATADIIRTHLRTPRTAPMLKLLQTEYVRGGSVGPPPGES
jgi:DNA-binding LacI/PurR family transcriptional regulator